MAFGIKEKVQLIFGIDEYTNGKAEVFATFNTMEFLKQHDLLDFDYSYENGPTMREFYNFLEQYKDRDIKLKLFVIDPEREDFRIGVNGILTAQKYADMQNQENAAYYMEYMVLTQKGNSHFCEDRNYFGAYWFD